MQTITSKDNQYLKMARAAQSKKGREEYGLYLVEGRRLAKEAHLAGIPLSYGLFCEETLVNTEMAELAQSFEHSGLPLFQVPERFFRSLSDTKEPQGIMLLAELPKEERPWPAISRGFFAYGQELRDPGNLGTIIRSAFAAGCQRLFLSPGSADIYNPKVIRSAMGASFRLPIAQNADSKRALEHFREQGVSVFLTAADGRDIRECKAELGRPHVWILGSEAHGAGSFWWENCDESISLPMMQGAESLNVSVAAGILFYQSLFALAD